MLAGVSPAGDGVDLVVTLGIHFDMAVGGVSEGTSLDHGDASRSGGTLSGLRGPFDELEEQAMV